MFTVTILWIQIASPEIVRGVDQNLLEGGSKSYLPSIAGYIARSSSLECKNCSVSGGIEAHLGR